MILVANELIMPCEFTVACERLLDAICVSVA
jgi:hypothetical protein